MVSASPGQRSFTLDDLKVELRDMAEERDWNQFHSPKNLVMALLSEAGELCEHFQWLKAEESSALPTSVHNAVKLEVADVLIYLVRLADKLDIDLLEAAHVKLELNRAKYPVEKS